MKIIIIDNKDSFTYNLAHYVGQFSDCVDVFRPNQINIKQISNYDKIILSPGPGLPEEHESLFQIIKAYCKKKSILGVCLGHQAIAQYFDAQLEHLSIVKHGVTSVLYQKRDCDIFRDLPISFKIGHYHSWVVSKDNFPACLEVTSEDDNNIITSFKHRYFDLQGVQFHPESILTEYGLQIINNWVIS